MQSKKILPPTYVLIAIVIMVVLHLLSPVTVIISLPWNVIGLLPLLLGIGINLMADAALRKAKTTVKPFEESSALVTSGVYRISRHPMYLGFVFILIGVAIMLGSLIPFLVIPVFAVLIDMVFIRVEERMLGDKFGRAWLDYQRRVRRWI
jgi:protein-S-isoprenylcysteine O-methyltransferase Ste14